MTKNQFDDLGSDGEFFFVFGVSLHIGRIAKKRDGLRVFTRRSETTDQESWFAQFDYVVMKGLHVMVERALSELHFNWEAAVNAIEIRIRRQPESAPFEYAKSTRERLIAQGIRDDVRRREVDR